LRLLRLRLRTHQASRDLKVFLGAVAMLSVSSSRRVPAFLCWLIPLGAGADPAGGRAGYGIRMLSSPMAVNIDNRSVTPSSCRSAAQVDEFDGAAGPTWRKRTGEPACQAHAVHVRKIGQVQHDSLASGIRAGPPRKNIRHARHQFAVAAHQGAVASRSTSSVKVFAASSGIASDSRISLTGKETPKAAPAAHLFYLRLRGVLASIRDRPSRCLVRSQPQIPYEENRSDYSAAQVGRRPGSPGRYWG